MIQLGGSRNKRVGNDTFPVPNHPPPKPLNRKAVFLTGRRLFYMIVSLKDYLLAIWITAIAIVRAASAMITGSS